MSRENLISIILAGGIGTRIKHKTPKVLLKIKDKTLIGTSINLAEIFSDKINIVINKTLIFLKNEFKNYNFFLQKSSLGTGHAVKEFFKNKKFNQQVLENIPLGRLAEENDVSTAVAFLAADSSNSITGTSFMVDGGWTAK